MQNTNIVRHQYQITQASEKGGCEEDPSIRKKEVIIKTFENNFCKNSLLQVASLIILKSDSSVEAVFQCFSVSAMQERCSNNSIYNPDVQKSGLSYEPPVQFMFVECLKLKLVKEYYICSFYLYLVLIHMCFVDFALY